MGSDGGLWDASASAAGTRWSAVAGREAECRSARPMKVKAFAEIFRGASADDRYALPGV